MHPPRKKQAAFDTPPDPSLQLKVNWCTSGCLISGAIGNAAGALLSAKLGDREVSGGAAGDPRLDLASTGRGPANGSALSDCDENCRNGEMSEAVSSCLGGKKCCGTLLDTDAGRI
jgi:hypothetical protein